MRRFLAALLILGIAAWALLETQDSGRWVCGICGRHERTWSVAGVTLTRQRLPSTYHNWFEVRSRLAHEHDWTFQGCHRQGFLFGAIACRVRGLPRLHDAILQVKDPAKALEIVRVLARMSHEERFKELDEADRSFPGLDGDSRAYAAWWDAHPVWKGLFPDPAPERP